MTKIAVAMSGGVDSSVAAAVLKREGYEVVGVTMRFWECEYAVNCAYPMDTDDSVLTHNFRRDEDLW